MLKRLGTEMRLSIDTGVDTFESAMAAVHAAYGRVWPDVIEGDQPSDDEPDNDNGYLPDRWSRRRLRKLVSWLGDSDAAEALRFIAERAPAAPMDEVFLHMADHTGLEEFNGKHMGGRMSAVGHARNHIGGGVGEVYDTDYANRVYRMDKRLAAALLEEMERQAS